MQILSSVMLFVVACLFVAYVILTEGTDWIGRAEIIEQRWPRLWAIMSNRPMRLVLIAVAIGMLTQVSREFENGEDPPQARFAPPGVPAMQAEGPKAEDPASLRRRTMRVADEMYDYFRARAQDHPPYAYPDPNNPNLSDERKEQIKKCMTYDQQTGDYYSRHFKERLIGIIREYNAKGVRTGFLEASAQQRPLYIAVPGVIGEGSLSDELSQFRDLAYRVDAYDNLVVLNPDSK